MLKAFTVGVLLLLCTFTSAEGEVDVVFSNESGRRCEVFWIHNEAKKEGTYDEKFVKSIGANEKYVERTHAAAKFFVKFDGKIGDAFITSDQAHQYHVIQGKSNQMAKSAKEL
jgi:hypothetical protein